MESKKAMFCVSHCRGHHSARPQNGTDALTFTYVVSSLPKLSFYYFLFVFTQLFILLISQSEALPTFVLRSPISSFSLTDSQLQLW